MSESISGYINISKLPPDEKKKIWLHIKESNPAEAKLINDLQPIIKAFDASVMMRPSRYLEIKRELL